ncbi:MAG TPA: nucleoside deaminase [Methylomirabilota bacterium]|nr:nucleoside deaminase [Methylomirabilota bacterium]
MSNPIIAPSRLLLDVPVWVDEVTRPGGAYPDDGEKMALVIRLARENVARRTGGPFGAAVFERESGRLVAAGVNSVTRLHNCVLHAEVMAIMLAQQQVRSHTLSAHGRPAHELVTSCEPCAMCLGATLYSGVSRVVMAASREDATAVGFDEGPVFAESYLYLADRGVSIVRDVRRTEAVSVLQAYRAGGGPIYNARPPVT